MRTGYSVNRIELVIKVLLEFAPALRAFAAKLLQRRLEPSLLDSSKRTVSASGSSEWIGEREEIPSFETKNAIKRAAPTLILDH